MRNSRLLFNLIVALTLVMAALGNPSTAAHAGNDGPKADPRLLQLAAENPNATFMVIIQKNPKNRDLKDADPEVAVQKGGGKLRKKLDMIVGFSAELTGREITKLAKNPKVRWISVDAPMASTAVVSPNSGSVSPFAGAVRATELWDTLTGQGVGVAVVDSGINDHPDIQGRIIVSINETAEADANDNYVHGTHVGGIIAGDGSASGGTRMGIAPGANLINVKVSDSNGMSYASDFVDGLEWIYNNRTAYNIRVVNISMNSTVAESYHNSPIDAAVEILWFNGIVVVVSAGNNGSTSGPVPLFPPANDPFVITVGAARDQGTASITDDAFEAFSAYGTTEDGYAKPDLVAPGRDIISLLASTQAQGYINHPSHRVDEYYFRMSGTSMSAPMVSGAIALLLQDEPNLTPDQVKFRLMATANTAWPNYVAAKSGAGYLDAYAAVYGTTTESANTGVMPSQMLSSGSEPTTWGSVGWNSVGWNSVGWNSVGWNSVGWNSVGWNSVGWNSGLWDD